jgi:hypothetical protein
MNTESDQRLHVSPYPGDGHLEGTQCDLDRPPASNMSISR